ncbi:hypothetical protein OQJ02_04735 [Legionella sp. PATHC032]|uniref:hypothetical protein n=1 Tax=Legionella sp. PATHC032 TaxID=2992039 RepID=UPI001B0383DD|nr:hypothetical protein [Legionella sp. PATHC032]MCW8420935.1 hypothetical protein [Legionella sp. PATHC032]HBA1634176.1 hypothetical protein [Legionella pneumophila]
MSDLELFGSCLELELINKTAERVQSFSNRKRKAKTKNGNPDKNKKVSGLIRLAVLFFD